MVRAILMAVMPTDHQARSQDFIYISLAALENFEAKDGLLAWDSVFLSRSLGGPL